MDTAKGPVSLALSRCFSIGVPLLLIFFLVAGDKAGANCFANPTTITITQPDGYDDTIAEGDDFATVVLGDPWDMEQLTDIFQPMNIGSISVSDGIFSGSSTSDDPYFWVLHPGFPSVQNIGKNGVNYPIDASRYTRLSFRLWLPLGTGSYAHIYWNADSDPADIAGFTDPILVSEGWHIYDIDLPAWVQQGSWSGQITGLRIDPFTLSGVSFEFDWVRPSDPSSSPSYTIVWSGQGNSASLFFDDDGDAIPCNTQIPIALGIDNTGSYSWTPNLPPGEYYIYVEVDGNGSCSLGPLTINQAPILKILAPSMTSGEDYAATVLGDPWDMSNPEDIAEMNQIARFDFAGGIFDATTTGEHNPWGDPKLLLPVSESTPIDTSRYKYLTWRTWHEGEQDIGNGWVARYLWAKTALGSDHSTSDDFVIWEGWNSYKIDLSKALLEPGSPNLGWTGAVRKFRFDPTEVPRPVVFHLDYIHLRADDGADRSFRIAWELKDPDSICTVSLYYDTDMEGFDGTLIATLEAQIPNATIPGESERVAQRGLRTRLGLPQQPTGEFRIYLPFVMRAFHPCPGACYNWDTVSVPAGEYYIYAVVEDDHNVTRWYSETPVIISH